MKIYTKLHSLKVDNETDLFLNSLNKKSEFIRIAIKEKRERENLIKVDKRKNRTIEDLKRSLDNYFN